MSARHRLRARPQGVVWLLGAVLTLGYYFLQSVRPPVRTSLGLERRLFPLRGGAPLLLLEAPAGGRWLLVTTPFRLDPSGSGTPWPSQASPLGRVPWPPSVTARGLSAFMDAATWLLEGSTLRGVWGVPAMGWLDQRHLFSQGGESSRVAIFDLRRNRERRMSYAELETSVPRSWREAWYERLETAFGGLPAFFYPSEEDAELQYPLAAPPFVTALEELSQDMHRAWAYGHVVIDGRWFYLVHTTTTAAAPGSLYVVSNDPAPRIRLLTRDAPPWAVSGDGRTVFFLRGAALWRLDLHQPLPALLDAIRIPELPDPLADEPHGRDRESGR